MKSDIDKALNSKDPADLSHFRSPETLFHEAMAAGTLDEIVQKFPGWQKALPTIQAEVLSVGSLGDGWRDALLSEVQQLVALVPEGRLPKPSAYRVGDPDYDTDEMFTLRGELSRTIRKHTAALDPHARAFLNEFYFGIDFTHWTKWAVLVRHTDLAVTFPTIILARRNDVDFALHGGTLVISK